MLTNNSRKNISNLYIWLPFIVIASKIIRWKFMLNQLIFMSIGWGMVERINAHHNIHGGVFAGVAKNAEWLFYHINIFRISSFGGWEIFFTIIYNIAFLLVIVEFYKKNPYAGSKENIFIYLNLAVLNIFCFTMSKESYQVIFWFLLAWLITHYSGYKKKTTMLMVGLAITVVFARKYYALIGLYYWVIVFYMKRIDKNINSDKSADRKKMIGNLLGLFIVFALFHFLFMGTMANADEDQYHELVRVNTRESGIAASEIAPIFRGNQLMMTLDYFIKIFRLTLPFELLIKAKPTYFITIAYQFLLASFILRAFKNRGKESIEDLAIEKEDEEEEEEEEEIENDDEPTIQETRDRIDTRTICLYTYIAFLLCSAMFEPDFGSWLRHQCVALPVILYIL